MLVISDSIQQHGVHTTVAKLDFVDSHNSSVVTSKVIDWWQDLATKQTIYHWNPHISGYIGFSWKFSWFYLKLEIHTGKCQSVTSLYYLSMWQSIALVTVMA